LTIWTDCCIELYVSSSTLQLELFTAFKAQHPSFEVEFTKFHSLKPWFVKQLCEWNTCCCCYHTELRYLLDALNGMRINEAGIHSSCTYKCLPVCRGGCQPEGTLYGVSTATFPNLTSFWSSVLCEKGVDEFWHSKDCLLGNCADCGVTTMLWVCSGELNS
jgi:hypothetical protein